MSVVPSACIGCGLIGLIVGSLSQAVGSDSIAGDPAAKVSVLSAWLRSMLDPESRKESAFLTQQLSELPAFADIAPAKEIAASLRAAAKAKERGKVSGMAHVVSWNSAELVPSDQLDGTIDIISYASSSGTTALVACLLLTLTFCVNSRQLCKLVATGAEVAGLAAACPDRAAGLRGCGRTCQLEPPRACHRWRPAGRELRCFLCRCMSCNIGRARVRQA